MKTVSKISQLRQLVALAKAEGKEVGFVPTMGYLHEGHLSLVEQCKAECGYTVVSIFVNPTQFGEGEDLDSYPRNLERDEDLCRAAGVDLIFAPTPEEVYPEGYQTTVHLSEITRGLCGAVREGHFDGVATVVLKLFNMVAPHRAYFGEKDYQQLQVIKRMALDLNLDIEIQGVPIMREEDGLAMSSRNTYLDEEGRVKALSLSSSLGLAEKLVAEGERDVPLIEGKVGEVLRKADVKVDYIEIRDISTLEKVDIIEKEAVLAIAGFVGKTRLIDNVILTLTGTSQT